nr:MAG TPA: hypothetical protein [Caudoviricetes sp.]
MKRGKNLTILLCALFLFGKTNRLDRSSKSVNRNAPACCFYKLRILAIHGKPH